MLARVLSVDVASGLPSFSTVGLPQGAVREAKERMVAAIQNSGFTVPPRRITVNLAPADVRKEGSAFELPIAVGILAGIAQVAPGRLDRYALLGELGLDGGLRPVRGALPIAVAARAAGLAGFILPRENVAEAAVVEGLEVRGAASLGEVLRFLDGGDCLERASVDVQALFRTASASEVDFADGKGQEHVKRAPEVAAAGSHNLLILCAPDRLLQTRISIRQGAAGASPCSRVHKDIDPLR